ncbi:MAG TPA: YdcF family protein [Pseudonocardiaceae bacterium]|nr:YdcF family protein [Pseudonocardiaceae bacterium]
MTGSAVSLLRRWLVRGALAVVVALVLLVGGTAFRIWQYGRIDDRGHADVILVLGAAQYNGDPSAILRNRLDHARALYDEGVAGEIVTVGGRRPLDRFTEAQASGMYLVSQGVPSDRIVEVNTGNDTLNSLRAAAGVLRQHSWGSAVLVSDPWHMFRAETMAEDSGIDAWTSPTHSGPAVQTRTTQLKYIVRETAALLFYRVTKAPADDSGPGIG